MALFASILNFKTSFHGCGKCCCFVCPVPRQVFPPQRHTQCNQNHVLTYRLKCSIYAVAKIPTAPLQKGERCRSFLLSHHAGQCWRRLPWSLVPVYWFASRNGDTLKSLAHLFLSFITRFLSTNLKWSACTHWALIHADLPLVECSCNSVFSSWVTASAWLCFFGVFLSWKQTDMSADMD